MTSVVESEAFVWIASGCVWVLSAVELRSAVDLPLGLHMSRQHFAWLMAGRRAAGGVVVWSCSSRAVVSYSHCPVGYILIDFKFQVVGVC